MTLSDRIAQHYIKSRQETLDLAWVEKYRKDFLLLMKQVPKAVDYETAIELSAVFNRFRSNFEALIFENFIKRSLPAALSDSDYKYYEKRLRSIAWPFIVSLSLPLNRADSYWSPEARYRQYQGELKSWEARVRKSAQDLWKELKSFVSWCEARKGTPLTTEVADEVRVNIEGFAVLLYAYNPEDKHHANYMSALREGLKRYRKGASARCPLLLKSQRPIKVSFDIELDKGGTYSYLDGLITFFASSTGSAGEGGPNWTARVMAHEMGHHVYKAYLGGSGREFWQLAIHNDFGDLDLAELLANWPGDAWAFQFPEILGEKDPVLALQVDALSHSSHAKELQSKKDFQELYDRGERTLKVPKHPITGYANKNPEEAFCEALSLLVVYGPRAVDPTVRRWLDVIMGDKIKLASLHDSFSKVQKV